jgi:iron(III) transport system ATP-binding protein
VTTVYVTHDQLEALALSNAVGVMQAGKLEQVGRPRDVYFRPGTRFVAGFVGASNLIEGIVEGNDGDGLVVVRTPEGPLRARSRTEWPTESRVLVVVRPEHVAIEPSPNAGGEDGAWHGTVVTRAFLGSAMDHVVAVGDRELRVRGPVGPSIRPGTSVRLRFSSESCAIVELDAEAAD